MDSSNESLPVEAHLIDFSAAYDELGPSSELTAVGMRLGISDCQQKQMIADWQQASLRLNHLPVAQANVADRVMQEILHRGSQATVPVVQQRPAASNSESFVDSRKNRRQLAKIVALATSSVAMLYVALHVATHEQSLNRSAEVLAAFSFDPQGWDVVVVTVSDEQADQLSRDLGQTPASGDLQMLSLLENQNSEVDSVGVMMASKETSQKLLVKFAETPSQSDAQWNPKMVGELDRNELLKRFALSMKTPTKSDLFFREVIVVTSDQDNGFQATARATDTASNTDTIATASNTSAADLKAQHLQQEGQSMLMQMQNSRQKPVLVVLKRRSKEAPDSQGGILPADPGFAVYF